MRDIKVQWTGYYPSLCYGNWVITIDGETKTLSYKDNAGTFGTYSNWWFDDEYSEQFGSYEEGMCFDEWIESEIADKILSELILFKLNEDEIKRLFLELQENDWRSSSCGGCI